VAILSDEIYAHQIYEGGPASLMQVPGLRDRVVLLDGWSKTFAMTGWRIGYGVWPAHLIDHVRKLITINHSCVNGVAQMTALAALTGPMEPIEEFRQIFMGRRKVVVDRLNALPGVSCRLPGGAFYAFPNISDTGWASRELASRLLEEAGVALMHGESFGDNGKGYLRVSYAASTDAINEAMDRTGEFLESQSPA
jgi:aspartate aminotransferase